VHGIEIGLRELAPQNEVDQLHPRGFATTSTRKALTLG
jgi:hypothetical protein